MTQYQLPDRQEVDPGPPEWTKRIRLTPASSFKIRAVKWGWEGRMPIGALTLVPGREGVGKSTFFAWLAAAITRGTLPGYFEGTPKAVLYAASEDAWEFTIAPRLKAAGADMDRVYRIDTISEEDGMGGTLNLPRDCRDLPDVARHVDAAALLCDPILSLVDENINSFKGQELRRALEPLTRAAEKAQIAVPALIHFNKGGTGDVGTMISGARAWSEVARAVIAIAEDKEADEYTCVVSQTKNNLGRKDLPHLTYTIDTVALPTDEADEDGQTVFAHVGMLRWTGETDRGAEELLNTHLGGEEPKAGKTMQKIIDFVGSVWKESGRGVSSQDVCYALQDEVKAATVRQTLKRAVDRKKLESPAWGIYRPVLVTVESVTTPDLDNPQPEVEGSDSSRFPVNPPYPPVTTSQLSHSQVNTQFDAVTNESGSCHKCHKLLNGSSRDSCDSCDRGERAPARADTEELRACQRCYTPTTNLDEDGRPLCDTCADNIAAANKAAQEQPGATP